MLPTMKRTTTSDGPFFTVNRTLTEVAMAFNAAADGVSVYRRRDRSKNTRLRILNFRPKI